MPEVADNTVGPGIVEDAIEIVAGGNKSEFGRALDISRETVYKYAREGLAQDQTAFAFRLMARSPELRDLILDAAGVTLPRSGSPQVRRFADRMAVIEEADPEQWDRTAQILAAVLADAEARIGPDRLGKVGRPSERSEGEGTAASA